jgi:hypothetical protein
MDGIFKPVVSFMKVDLPQPDGPTMAMNSPWRTFRSMASTAKWFCGQQLVVVGQPDILEVHKPGLGILCSISHQIGLQPPYLLNK